MRPFDYHADEVFARLLPLAVAVRLTLPDLRRGKAEWREDFREAERRGLPPI